MSWHKPLTLNPKPMSWLRHDGLEMPHMGQNQALPKSPVLSAENLFTPNHPFFCMIPVLGFPTLHLHNGIRPPLSKLNLCDCICLSVHLSIHLSIYLSVHLPICKYLSIYLSIYALCIYLSVYIELSIYLSIYLSVRLSVFTYLSN